MTENSKTGSLKELFTGLSKMCAGTQKPIVLMIDEVDSASNNQVFIDFLAQLRGYYLAREKKPIFYSVILAGVYDLCRKEGPIADGGIPYDLRAHQRTTLNIKNLKLKLRPDAEHKYSSPWNIAEKFNIDMNFSAEQIAAMLQEYENEKHTNMDIDEVSKCIYAYTCGYPYLVSAICKQLDRSE